MADDLTGFCGNAGPEEIMDGLAANPGSCRAKQRARQWFSPPAPHPFEEIDPSWNTHDESMHWNPTAKPVVWICDNADD